jgi:protein-S-isoprenylcysteine O-methyltransferase
MTTPIAIYISLLLLMPLVDTTLLLVYRRKIGPQSVFDRTSLLVLWGCVIVGLIGAAYFRSFAVGRIRVSGSVIPVIAIIVMATGLVLRWVAMITLGRYFSPHVEIADDQPLTISGIYRYVRHPAYTGIILVFIGLGLAFANWLSLVSVASLSMAGIANRVRIEEAALFDHYGDSYASYAAHTKRFVPYLF